MLALIGHGHHWPGSESSSQIFLVGENNTTELNANEAIGEFFGIGEFNGANHLYS